MINEKELRLDYFIDPQRKVFQDPEHFCFNTDTRLLAQFSHIKKGETVLDIGTNNGVLLVYASQFGPKKLIGVEVLEHSYELACFNAGQFIKQECEIIHAPIQDVSIDPVDVILSNPPFFEVRELHPDTKITKRALGRFEINCTLEELISSAARLLKSNGRFYFVHRPDRIFEIFLMLGKYKFSVKRIQVAYDARSRGAKSLLVEAIKDGHTKTRIEDSVWI